MNTQQHAAPQVHKARHAIGAAVRGIALVAHDGFSARYDLDRIGGTFSRPAHKLAGQSYVGRILVLDTAKGGVASAWMLREMASRGIVPLAIVFSAIGFNAVNGGLNGWWLGFAAPPDRPVPDALSLMGTGLFVAGMLINHWADTKLIGLRARGTGYVVPRGGLFERISCPNHFGEIAEWTGFALAAWSLPALSFAVWSFCNLAPRARNHHAWYRERFPDYPAGRRAVIPYIW